MAVKKKKKKRDRGYWLSRYCVNNNVRARKVYVPA